MHRSCIGRMAVAAAALATAVAWRWQAPADAPQPQADPAAATAPAVPAPSDPAAAAAPAVVTFPDGTQRPALNQVTESVELRWPGDTPYAPVIDTVRDGDTEWFQHGDGSWSTTLRRLDQASGRYVTLCPLYQPGPARPTRLSGQ